MPFSLSSAWRRTSSWKLVLPPSMIVSPGSRCSSSSAICASVASPAGTMTQTARGFASAATSSAIENDGLRALAGDLLGLLRRPVVDDDLVPVADEPADHVGAHPAETDEPDAHRGQASVGVARAAASARSRAARPASGSAPRWTRRIGRSCDSMAPKSPAAWASMSWPKRVRPARDRDGRPGGPRSAGGTSRSARRPCGAGRSSAGSAGRSRPSSRAASGRAAASGSGRWPRRAPAVGAMNAWRRGRRPGGGGRGGGPAPR